MNKSVRSEFTKIVDNFQKELKVCEYFGEYFDRLAPEESKKLCDNKGWFPCQGAFDAKDCYRAHNINPYASKDARVLFSTWNLDHR